jgi:hypothetical protein
VGDRLELAVDPGRFHLFDHESGRSLVAGEQEAASKTDVVLTTS